MYEKINYFVLVICEKLNTGTNACRIIFSLIFVCELVHQAGTKIYTGKFDESDYFQYKKKTVYISSRLSVSHLKSLSALTSKVCCSSNLQKCLVWDCHRMCHKLNCSKPKCMYIQAISYFSYSAVSMKS